MCFWNLHIFTFFYNLKQLSSNCVLSLKTEGMNTLCTCISVDYMILIFLLDYHVSFSLASRSCKYGVLHKR